MDRKLVKKIQENKCTSFVIHFLEDYRFHRHPLREFYYCRQKLFPSLTL